MARPSAFIAAVLITAAAVSVSVSTPATAAPAEVTIQGIGQQVTVHSGIVQADLKPIPGTAAPNTGIARPGDNLAAICFSRDSRGEPWILVLNRNGISGVQYANTVGYISQYDLSGNVVVNGCATTDVRYPAHHFAWLGLGLTQADMKPIAGTDAPNTGLFKQGDKAAIYCFLADNRGVWWVLAVNLSGHAGQQYANTAGFVRDDATRPEFAGGVDCGAS